MQFTCNFHKQDSLIWYLGALLVSPPGKFTSYNSWFLCPTLATWDTTLTVSESTVQNTTFVKDSVNDDKLFHPEMGTSSFGSWQMERFII